ncbi:hypothetical protein SAMN05216576_1067 [Ectopseudomonas chengduensis]|uniref:Uncharacterized protein n=1 Tax=Ectopseudomonas chengduensis TaxID=489632 RepID=A0A1G6P000_9GAMM|nr:hypothetical protein [Pseudomonas chengduensis]MBP3063694.1 hypothetical protein [Pseudomonas chengduensis]NNB73427.1 hypothetical protein [Pseudomonas chengduensis]SDC72924.1 hypothetical protein SAMN05216576_1067 [Pseudomonas chengduensis]
MAGKPKHGLSYTPEYRAWQQMRLRCTKPTHAAYANYGGRGITVCDRWLNDPAAFIADMGLKPSPKHEIDRIDNQGNYEPSNCRWVTRSANDRNRRNNRVIHHDGIDLSLAEWSERTGVPADTIRKRIESGWEIARALTEPARLKSPKGKAKHALRHPCLDCARPVTGKRCHACENANRVKRANLVDQQQSEVAA